MYATISTYWDRFYLTWRFIDCDDKFMMNPYYNIEEYYKEHTNVIGINPIKPGPNRIRDQCVR